MLVSALLTSGTMSLFHHGSLCNHPSRGDKDLESPSKTSHHAACIGTSQPQELWDESPGAQAAVVLSMTGPVTQNLGLCSTVEEAECLLS